VQQPQLGSQQCAVAAVPAAHACVVGGGGHPCGAVRCTVTRRARSTHYQIRNRSAWQRSPSCHARTALRNGVVSSSLMVTPTHPAPSAEIARGRWGMRGDGGRCAHAPRRPPAATRTAKTRVHGTDCSHGAVQRGECCASQTTRSSHAGAHATPRYPECAARLTTVTTQSPTSSKGNADSCARRRRSRVREEWRTVSSMGVSAFAGEANLAHLR